MSKTSKTYNTIKLPVEYSSTDDLNLVLAYQRQQTHIVRSVFRKCEKNEHCDFNSFNHYNDIDLLDSWWKMSAVYEGKAKYDAKKKIEKKEKHISICFGSKQLMNDYKSGKISKDEFRIKRLNPLISIGEKFSGTKPVKANRKFKLSNDVSCVYALLNKQKIKININSDLHGKYKDILPLLYKHQEAGDMPITYRLDSEYIYITYAVEYLIQNNPKQNNSVKDRVFAIDLNPNYVGWSVVDWESSSEFNIIDSGVVSLKDLNDKERKLHLPSSDPRRKHLSNVRQNEVYLISQYLITKAAHYRCGMFGIEKLVMESKDTQKGKRLNRLINNQWNRDKLVSNLKKRCVYAQIDFVEVLPNYSSFVGNFLYRSLNLPDMCLASIEIGRRTYEFKHQYIIKDKEQIKNIMFPRLSDFKNFMEGSVEEFDLKGMKDSKSLKDIYSYFKDSKVTYRVSLDSLKPEFLMMKSDKLYAK